jgi:multiple sugar transport system permease protein
MKTVLKGIIALFAALPMGILLLLSVPQFSALVLAKDYWIGYGNSLLLTGPIVILQLLVAILAAYGLARWRGSLRNVVYLLYCILTLLPCQVMLLPNYLVCRSLGLLNSRLSIILLGVFSPLSVFLLSRQMLKIGKDQAEAASLDGASEWQIFLRIYLPQMKEALLIAAGLAFLDCWSMVELPLVLLSSPEKQPLSILMTQPDFPAPYAGAVIYVAPIGIALLATYCIRAPGAENGV